MSAEVTEAAQLAITAYKLAWKYRRAVQKQWEPRLEEIRKLDEFHRTSVAWENAMTRSDWLCEEAGYVLLRAVSDRQPLGVDRFKAEVFERCRNRLWLKAFDAYKIAFEAAFKAAPTL